MAGASFTFTSAGYKIPKYMLPLQNKSVFFRAVSSFAQYFNKIEFIFVYRDLCGTKDFITERMQGVRLGKLSRNRIATFNARTGTKCR